MKQVDLFNSVPSDGTEVESITTVEVAGKVRHHNHKPNVGSSACLVNIEQYGCQNLDLKIGDVVRSYRSPFESELVYKNCYIEGVIINMETWVSHNDSLLVKWNLQNWFGRISRVKLPHNGSDTFPISKQSPHLVKVNNQQLQIAL